ncbi:hypothetical protein HYV88_02680 [Candidatus Woesearchaeota archaeon]|nr:hypothetical protein [Candidatus Woesearchaeota archaeon]
MAEKNYFIPPEENYKMDFSPLKEKYKTRFDKLRLDKRPEIMRLTKQEIAAFIRKLPQFSQSQSTRPPVVYVTRVLDSANQVMTIPPEIGELERMMFSAGAEQVQFKDCTYQRASDIVSISQSNGKPIRVLEYRIKQ